MKLNPISGLLLAVMLAGCGQTDPQPDQPATRQEAQAFDAFLAASWQARLQESPELSTLTGSREGQDKWDDVSVESLDTRHFRIRTELANMLKLAYTSLGDDQRLSYELFENEAERRIEQYRFRLLPYPVNPYLGLQVRAPELLIDHQPIATEADAEAYLARLRALKPLLAQVESRLAASATAGAVLPKFIFPRVESGIRAWLRGRPFESGADSPLLKDFKDKVAAAEIEPERRTALVQAASVALTESVKPAYDSLLRALKAQEKNATDDAGAWKLPGGDGYYRAMLRFHTTSDLSPGEMHEIGLAEVARLHGELQALAGTLGIEGPLPSVFKAMQRRDASYPRSEAGREALVTDMTGRIEALKPLVMEAFKAVPSDALVVGRARPDREPFADPIAYLPATGEGSSVARIIVNTGPVVEVSKSRIEAWASAYGIPGVHLQSATTRAIAGLPPFRRHFPARAFTTGWALYATRLAKEAGAFASPESEYGRLLTELDAAIALVVDTGIHARRWTREQAIQYVLDSSPVTRAAAARMVERSSVLPAEGAAATMGFLKLLELRQRAEGELGQRFNPRDFHDAVLSRGPLPLNALAREVSDYIERTRSSPAP